MKNPSINKNQTYASKSDIVVGYDATTPRTITIGKLAREEAKLEREMTAIEARLVEVRKLRSWARRQVRDWEDSNTPE